MNSKEKFRGPKKYKKRTFPDCDLKTDRIYDLRIIQDQRRSGESDKHERLVQYRVGQR